MASSAGEHAVKNISSNENLWGASVKKRHATKRGKNANSSVNRDFGFKGGVIEGNGAPTRQGPCSDSAREGSTLGATVKTSGL